MLRAVICDMDGVLVDSEKNTSDACVAALRKYGVILTPNGTGCVHQVGVRFALNIQAYVRDYDIQVDPELLLAEVRSEYTVLIARGVKEMPGATRALERFKSWNLPMGLATMSQRWHVEAILNQLEFRSFKSVLTGTDVKRHKPDPEVYLRSAIALGVRPDECLVVEDSEAGVCAGQAAGAAVVAVPNRFTQNHDFSKADRVVENLDQITMELVSSIFSR